MPLSTRLRFPDEAVIFQEAPRYATQGTTQRFRDHSNVELSCRAEFDTTTRNTGNLGLCGRERVHVGTAAFGCPPGAARLWALEGGPEAESRKPSCFIIRAASSFRLDLVTNL